ncbi:MAG: nuclear transport factor 2 family protein, partial [bacterium]|nr:nuclear transport factor 2 family protein [bacterium]
MPQRQRQSLPGREIVSLLRVRQITPLSQSLPPRRGKVRMGGIRWFTILLCLPLLLLGCEPSGDQVGDLTAPSGPSAQVELQAINNVLALYRETLLSEDIDRLQALLAPDVAVASTQSRSASTATAFRQTISDRFRSHTMLAHSLQQVAIAADRQSATFIDVRSSLNPDNLVQQTDVFRTTFTFVRLQEGAVTHFRIAEVRRDGPLLEVTTPGLLVAGPPSPLTL